MSWSLEGKGPTDGGERKFPGHDTEKPQPKNGETESKKKELREKKTGIKSMKNNAQRSKEEKKPGSDGRGERLEKGEVTTKGGGKKGWG